VRIVCRTLLTCIKLLISAAHRIGAAFEKGHPMLDVILVLGALAFFAASVAYGYACDRM
jgi:hypothetical protein